MSQREPSRLWLSAWCIVAAFGAYFCTYAFRKPFTAAEQSHYGDLVLWGVKYKVVLLTAQGLGYTLSKFIGIRVIAELPPRRRAAGIIALIVLASVALLLFGLVPPPWNFVALFLNGLPLGMIFGLILGYLEGRRVTEALTAGLCASFIISSDAVKSVGAYLLQWGVSPFWMPFVTGLIFALPLLGFVAMLTRIPPPSFADVARRRERTPMTRAERQAFFRAHALGLIALIGAYVFLNVLRSLRDDFAPELWRDLGRGDRPAIFAQSGMLVMLGVTIVNGAAIFIRDNRRAFLASLGLSLLGLVLGAIALLGVRGGWCGPFAFMVLLGVGLYVPYVAIHTTVFERLIAMVHDRGNLGYLMYLADAFGYLGVVAVMFGRNFLTMREGFLSFFLPTAGLLLLGTAVLLTLAGFYFVTRSRPAVPSAIPAQPVVGGVV